MKKFGKAMWQPYTTEPNQKIYHKSSPPASTLALEQDASTDADSTQPSPSKASSQNT